MQTPEDPHISFVQCKQPHLAPPMLGLHCTHFLRHQHPSSPLLNLPKNSSLLRVSRWVLARAFCHSFFDWLIYLLGATNTRKRQSFKGFLANLQLSCSIFVQQRKKRNSTVVVAVCWNVSHVSWSVSTLKDASGAFFDLKSLQIWPYFIGNPSKKSLQIYGQVYYRVAKTHRMPLIAGHFSWKSH